MTIPLQFAELPEPPLEFSGTTTYTDPKAGLSKDGPFSLRYRSGHPDHVRLGIVGPPEMVDAAQHWFERCHSPILSRMENRRRFPDYPGFPAIFHASLDLDDRWIVQFSPLEVARILAGPGRERFDAMVTLYAEAVATLARREMGPQVVVCSLSDDTLEKCWNLQRNSERRHHAHLLYRAGAQLSLGLMGDELEVNEDLLYRTFRRALKAKVMCMQDRLPIQIVQNHLLQDGIGKDDAATRAWSVSVGIFYKAGGVPWRLAHIQPHVCFVGVSFHRLRTTKREALYASLAQAFSTDIEGFVLRGERVSWPAGTEPHLTGQQAHQLGIRIREEYHVRAGRSPVRVTIHKTSRFSPEEREAFASAFDEVPQVELLSIGPSEFRLLTPGDYPPKRGTLCTVNEDEHFLYTTGFNDEWGTYPGPHVPAPLAIALDDNADLRRVCEETLGLTKMNWNSASMGGRDPITLHMARIVGPIMAEVPEDEEPQLSFRYYM